MNELMKERAASQAAAAVAIKSQLGHDALVATLAQLWLQNLGPVQVLGTCR